MKIDCTSSLGPSVWSSTRVQATKVWMFSVSWCLTQSSPQRRTTLAMLVTAHPTQTTAPRQALLTCPLSHIVSRFDNFIYSIILYTVSVPVLLPLAQCRWLWGYTVRPDILKELFEFEPSLTGSDIRLHPFSSALPDGGIDLV